MTKKAKKVSTFVDLSILRVLKGDISTTPSKNKKEMNCKEFKDLE